MIGLIRRALPPLRLREGQGEGERARSVAPTGPHPTLSQRERVPKPYLAIGYAHSMPHLCLRCRSCSLQRRLRFRLRCRNRLRMIFGNAFLAKGDVTLCTNKPRIFLLLIDFKIQSPTVIGCGSDVTSVRAAARTHRDL